MATGDSGRDLSLPPISDELKELLDDPRFAGIDLDTEFDPEAMMEELQQQQQRLEDAQRTVEASRFRMESEDGLFEVTVQGGAAIEALVVKPEAVREYEPHELGPRIVALINDAMAHGASIVREAFSGAFDDPAQFEQVFEGWPAQPAPEQPEEPYR